MLRLHLLIGFFLFFSTEGNSLTATSGATENKTYCNLVIFRIITAPERRYVHNSDEFLLHTNLHIQRVERLGLFLLSGFPNDFRGVSEELAKRFLAQHDQSKVNIALSRSFSRPIYERLYEFFGVPQIFLTPPEKEAFDLLTHELNSIDKELSYNFFRENGVLTEEGFPNQVGKNLLKLEAIADVIDRVKNKVSPEEFARSMYSADSSFERKDRIVVHLMEEFYTLIIEGLDYPSQRVAF